MKRVKHGFYRHPLYWIWHDIMKRCGHHKGAHEDALREYRDRGICVCEEWRRDPSEFIRWALANGWRKGLQIDRKDNNGNYCPDNCWFVEPKRNARNRRTTYLYMDGKPLADHAESFGIKVCDGHYMTNEFRRMISEWRRFGAFSVTLPF